MMKRIIALIISGILLITVFSVISFAAENIAYKKPTYASSIYAEQYHFSYANDGSTSSTFIGGDNKLEGLTAEGQQFLAVDLQGTYAITQVRFINRTNIDDAAYRTGYSLEFSNSRNFETFERIRCPGPVGFCEWYDIDVDFVTPYRYVRVTNSYKLINIAEIEVYGDEIVETGKVAEFDDIKDTRHEPYLELLNIIGVFDDVTGTVANVNKILTKAQACDILVKAVAREQITGSVNPFLDVNETTPFYDAIVTAYNHGLLSNIVQQEFKPTQFLTYNEAIYMLVNAAGYNGGVDEADMYNRIAREYGLVSAKTALNEYVSKAEFGRMIYKILTGDKISVIHLEYGNRVEYVKGKTLLYELYGYRLTNGTVTENNYSYLYEPKTKCDRKANVGGNVLGDPNNYMSELLGRNVEVVIDENDNIIGAYKTLKDEVVTIDAYNIISSLGDINKNIIKTLDDRNTKESYLLASNSDVLWNGVSYPDFTKPELLIKDGTITLIDSDKDGLYDVVCVDEYKLVYAENVTNNNGIRIITDENGNIFEITEDNAVVINGKTGRTTTVSNITAFGLYKMYSSKNGVKSKFIIINNNLSGRLNGYEADNYLILDDAEYTISTYLKNHKAAIPEIKIGNGYKIYIDDNNEVCRIDTDAGAVNSEWTIAYVMRLANSADNVETDVRFQVYTIHGLTEIYEVADKVTVDGDRYSKDKLSALITANPLNFKGNFIRFKLNEDKAIKSIDTMYRGVKEDEYTMSEGPSGNGGSFVTEVDAIYDFNKFVISAKANTPTFVIPTVDGHSTDDERYDNLYQMKIISNVIWNHNVAENVPYKAFMLDKEGYPQFFVRYIDYSSGLANLNIDLIDPEYDMMLVEGTGIAVINDQEVLMIKGIDLYSGMQKNIYVDAGINIFEAGKAYQYEDGWKNDKWQYFETDKVLSADASKLMDYVASLNTLGTGDIIRYRVNNDGVVDAINRAFEYDVSSTPALNANVLYANHSTFFGGIRVQLARLESIDENMINFKSVTLENREPFRHSSFFENIFVIEGEGEKIKTDSKDNLANYISNGWICGYFTTNGKPCTLVLYKY